MEFFFQQLLNGLAVGGIYALVALGYTMVYGVLKLINFAHGDLFAIGAYLGLTLLVSCNLAGILSPLPAVLLVCVMVAMQVFMLRTKTGAAIRAVAIDQGAAQLMGINVNRVISLVFLIGPGLGGVAGIMVGIYYGQIDFLMGWSYGLKAFIAAILGGIGNIPGAMIGGLILGVSEALASAYIAVAWKDVVAFLVLILILIIRPTGLLGERTADKL